MKTSVIVALTSLLLCANSLITNAQEVQDYNVLDIYYTNMFRSVLVNEGTFVKVWWGTDDVQKVKGNFEIIDANSIKVEGKEIPLKEITKMRIADESRKVVGTLISVPGALFTIIGGLGLVAAITEDDLGGAIAALVALPIGGIMLAIGLPLVLSGKKYKPKSGWEITAH